MSLQVINILIYVAYLARPEDIFLEDSLRLLSRAGKYLPTRSADAIGNTNRNSAGDFLSFEIPKTRSLQKLEILLYYSDIQIISWGMFFFKDIYFFKSLLKLLLRIRGKLLFTALVLKGITQCPLPSFLFL